VLAATSVKGVMGDITSPQQKQPTAAVARKEPVSFTSLQINYFREVNLTLILQ